MEPSSLDTHAMIKTVDLPNGETYAYREYGNSSKVFLFLHSAYCSSFFLSSYISQLADTFRVISPDFRGHGHSTYDNVLNTVDDLADDIKFFVDALGLTKFTLCGWSTGGATAMKFAARYPELVERLILHGSVGAYGLTYKKIDENGQETNERAQRDEEILSLTFSRFLFETRTEQSREKAKKLISGMFLNARVQFKGEKFEQVVDDFLMNKRGERLPLILNKYNISHEYNGVTQGTGETDKIKCKVLILHGKKDAAVPFQDAEILKDFFKDQAVLKALPDAGHAVLVDHVEIAIPAIREFCSV